MTRRRFDEHSTEFGLWLRDQQDIASHLGYKTTNLDYIWENWKTGDYLFLEEKRYMAKLTCGQFETFWRLNQKHLDDKKYHGMFILRFEKTSSEDGKIYISKIEYWKKVFYDHDFIPDRKNCITELFDEKYESEISKEKLLDLFQFKKILETP
jgi:hypothetical protein